ncbi:MAG: hypothetical protein IK094_01270 [Treponema sp.]|nr:hypothetical protein [Treponema sp.]
MFHSENEFDHIIKQEWGLPVIYDGITNILDYKKAPTKILWILKEGNENEKQQERDHRDFHTNVSEYYHGWKSTYKNIILPTYGILHNTSYANLPSLQDDATVNGEYVLNSIALININKNGGGSQANASNIEENYTKHKNTLLQQIEGINPDVMINCSRVTRLFNDVAEKFKLSKKKHDARPEIDFVVDYAESSKKLIINYWHPGAHMTDESYQKMILDIYKKWHK